MYVLPQTYMLFHAQTAAKKTADKATAAAGCTYMLNFEHICPLSHTHICCFMQKQLLKKPLTKHPLRQVAHICSILNIYALSHTYMLLYVASTEKESAAAGLHIYAQF